MIRALRTRLHDRACRKERTRAGNIVAMIAGGIADALEALADDAQREALHSRSAALIAATYRDASDRARLIGTDIAETVRR